MLEKKLRLPRHAIQLELMVETPQSILTPDGRVALPALVKAGKGRVRGTFRRLRLHRALRHHHGVALCAISPAMCARDDARLGAGAGVRLSDGSSNLLPIPPPCTPEVR